MYHLFTCLLAPMPLAFLAVLSVSIYYWRRRPDARAVLLWTLTPVAVLLATCTPVVAYFLAGTLEWRYAYSALETNLETSDPREDSSRPPADTRLWPRRRLPGKW